MFVTAFAIGLLAAAPHADVGTALLQDTAMLQDTAQQSGGEGSGLAVSALSEGRSRDAIDALSQAHSADPSDPAVMINLGIAHATRGEDAAARALFEAAMTSRIAYDLDTAEGTAINSRKLARRALRMLERGEFRREGQVALRD